jgi:cytochrome c553
VFSASSAFAADIAAGKQKTQQECGSCHRPSDWEGETEASLTSLMKDIVRGKVKHHKKQLALSDQDIENIAAYWARNNKK